jgi:hypothetical protein
MARDERITWLSDVGPADWIASRLHPFNVDTGSVVPGGFEAYCRIFHPVEPQWPETRVKTWAEVAAENGRIVHPEMQFHMINRAVNTPAPLTYQQERGPRWGSLPLLQRAELVDALRPETTTPDRCWFCIWDGFGQTDRSGGQVHLPNRDYMLYAGSIELALASLRARARNLPEPVVARRPGVDRRHRDRLRVDLRRRLRETHCKAARKRHAGGVACDAE